MSGITNSYIISKDIYIYDFAFSGMFSSKNKVCGRPSIRNETVKQYNFVFLIFADSSEHKALQSVILFLNSFNKHVMLTVYPMGGIFGGQPSM
jgi:hypothetical protein